MTAQQNIAIANVNAKLAAQREQAQQAALPTLTDADRARSLFYAMEIARQAGRLDEARQYARELRPLVHLLPEAQP